MDDDVAAAGGKGGDVIVEWDIELLPVLLAWVQWGLAEEVEGGLVWESILYHM